MQIDKLKPEEVAEIDLHGFTVADAEEELILTLNELPKQVRALKVTHGYSHGTALKRMVKQDFYHWRLKSKQVSLNPGITWFVLK